MTLDAYALAALAAILTVAITILGAWVLVSVLTSRSKQRIKDGIQYR